MSGWKTRAVTLGAIVGLAMLATGCASSFYLSESEVTAYLANLRRESSANDLLQHFQGQTFQIEFDPTSRTPRIRSTNILTVLRAIPELFFIEQGFHQIHLDRLSTQLEQQLDTW